MTPLAHLYEILEKTRVENGLQGMSLAVLHRGELIFADGFGKRNEHDPFTAETLMPIASLTKAFTAAAIGELVAEGKMDWDTTPVNKYLSEFEFKDPVLTSQLTLVDLLSHRTGMPDIDLAWTRNRTPRRELFKTIRHIDTIPSKLKPYAEYSNTMYAVAGEAAANVANTTWEDLVQTRILDPLGLKDSGFSPLGMVERSDNHAMPFDASSLKDAQEGRFESGYLEDVVMVDAAAGDMFSNVLDLVKWGRVVMKSGELEGRQVLDGKSMEEVVTPHSIMRNENKTGRGCDFAITQTYGLGWFLDTYKGNNFYFHTGSVTGFRSSLAIYPDSDIVIAFLTNTNKSALRTYIPFYIVDQLLRLPKTEDWLLTVAVRETQVEYDEWEQARKGDFAPRVPGTSPSHHLAEYVGKYSSPYMGTVTIRLDNDDDEKEKKEERLVLEYSTFVSKMEHYHFDTFRVVFKDFGFDSAGPATFFTGADGRVSSMTAFADYKFNFERDVPSTLNTDIAAPVKKEG
ncbi:hypothetical protein BGX29_009399 [Mortierella sp. GBA35]|nr:hypothetical protein BGX29_009399 [Mortierella sp. GBA35]